MSSGAANRFCLIAALAALLLVSCSKPKQAPPAKPPVPVTADAAAAADVPVRISAIGNVEPSVTVAVKALVGGQVQKVHFREGQDVKKGDRLFTIDPRPYEAQLKQAEAALARDKAQLENAREDAKRYDELAAKGYVSKQQADLSRANFAALEASVQADAAAVESARLQLGYCRISSPVTGRTGNLVVDEGNIVKAGADTPMVVINQVRPINVTFSIPERELPRIRKYMSGSKLKVEAKPAGDQGPAETGEVNFLDNTVDAATATIKMKGIFSNSSSRLWPGQFVTVDITLSTLRDAATVPSQAVLTGQQGQFVFVVKGDTVEMRQVAVGPSFNGSTVIEKGLEKGEQVVTDGHMKLSPGAKIEIRKPGKAADQQPASKGSTSGPQTPSVK